MPIPLIHIKDQHHPNCRQQKIPRRRPNNILPRPLRRELNKQIPLTAKKAVRQTKENLQHPMHHFRLKCPNRIARKHSSATSASTITITFHPMSLPALAVSAAAGNWSPFIVISISPKADLIAGSSIDRTSAASAGTFTAIGTFSAPVLNV